MSPLLKKMMCIEWARRTYDSYLERREGKYFLFQAKFFLQCFELIETQRDVPVTSDEIMGVCTYRAYYWGEVLNRVERLPESQTIGRELADICIEYDDIKKRVPKFTRWHYMHFKSIYKESNFEGLMVSEVMNLAEERLLTAKMGILVEKFRDMKGRFPGIWERAQFTPEMRPIIIYRDRYLRSHKMMLEEEYVRE